MRRCSGIKGSDHNELGYGGIVVAETPTDEWHGHLKDLSDHVFIKDIPIWLVQNRHREREERPPSG